VAGGLANVASGTGSFVGGGGSDGISTNGSTASGDVSVVGGGLDNTANGYGATVGGGTYNTADDDVATVGGGYFNTAGEAATVVGGGMANAANGYGATVCGGLGNTANGHAATVVGGLNNVAAGNGSLVAGRNASDVNNGTTFNNSFVWGDGSRPSVSQGSNTFNVLATGGAYFYTIAGNGNYAINYMLLDSSGNLHVPGTVTANGVQLTSDRNAKEHFQPVDHQAVLAKVAALPVTEWNYKSDRSGGQHIGPMAQDFQAAFGLNGQDDKHISVVDETGVALAAIQGLNEKLAEKNTEIQNQAAEITGLKARLEKLEQLMTERMGGVK